MRPFKLVSAWLVSVAGLFMPWRMRILFSELLGWIAQLVPPQLYQLEDLDPKEGATAGAPSGEESP